MKKQAWLRLTVVIGLIYIAADVRAADMGPKYVMSVINKVRLTTCFGHADSFVYTKPGRADWYANPYWWRYGNWGGKGWSDGSKDGKVVDAMDALFREHDRAYDNARGNKVKIRLVDAWLLGILKKLNNGRLADRTPAFLGYPMGAPAYVKYWLKGDCSPRLINFSEYARRQAISGFERLLGY